MEIIGIINWIIAIFFTVCYSYQMFYIAVSLAEKVPFLRPLFKKRYAKLTPTEIKQTRYGILIAARNEEKVIGQLIDSIKAQDYPAELIDIFVIADNCTDSTKATAEAAGAIVYERFNKELIGKGYAMNMLLKKIAEDYPEKHDAFLVFDADNILEPNYITEMNKLYSAGYEVATSYRNSKNYADNWITAGYSLWFLREASYLNRSRLLLNTSCAVSGTGFMFSRKIIEECGGWNFFLLTEDIEFSIWNAAYGHKIGYCGTAMFYDEQPVTFKASWNQRLRWAKGYLQVFRYYGWRLLKGIFTRGSFSCYDMSMNIMPATVLSFAAIILNITALIMSIVTNQGLPGVLSSIVALVSSTYGLMFTIGGITTITEWKNIHCSAPRKILAVFTFPIFMFTYIPIALAALFKKVTWTPVEHSKAKDLNAIKKS